MSQERRLSRRTFFAWVSGAGAGYYFFGPGPGTAESVALAAIPGGTLDPGTITKFTTPLLIPPAMPRAGKIPVPGGKNIDYYEIAVRQFQQQILPSPLPTTTVWGYGPKAAQGGPQIFHAPSLTIEAEHETPVRIKWINELVNGQGEFLPHLFAVDQTLHWANPPGGVGDRDTRPTFGVTPNSYDGPVPLVTHVHGAVGVGDESDGYAEAWFLPAAVNIPGEFAKVGTWYDFFANKAKGRGFLAPGTSAWAPGTAVFQYPNTQRASTSWYHDHTLGMTRLNVYAGPAGFYLVRGGAGDKVIDTQCGHEGVLPGPAPARNDPPGNVYLEIPLAIQDRSFNTDGSLFYPDTRAFFDGIIEYIPDTDISPQWNPEFFGNCMMVNGATWPTLDVQQRRYRFRILNGCNSRFLILDFNNIPGVKVWQIGNEGGFLAAPFNVTADAGNQMLLGPAERADVIVDFTNVPRGAYVLGNVGPDAPFAGLPIPADEVADSLTTGQVMQFHVVKAKGADRSTPPQDLALPHIVPLCGGKVRHLVLLEKLSTFVEDAPAETMLGNFLDECGDPNTSVQAWAETPWEDPVTENPQVGAIEVWEFYNTTADAHPMHIHEVVFQVVNRQAIDFVVDEGGTAGTGIAVVAPESVPVPPEPWETGFKDTVIAYPGQVTRVRMRFGVRGQYVWHCHIVEHEDNEMMRPYRIGPPQDGQPDS